jgi:hypothetical protein
MPFESALKADFVHLWGIELVVVLHCLCLTKRIAETHGNFEMLFWYLLCWLEVVVRQGWKSRGCEWWRSHTSVFLRPLVDDRMSASKGVVLLGPAAELDIVLLTRV